MDERETRLSEIRQRIIDKFADEGYPDVQVDIVDGGFRIHDPETGEIHTVNIESEREMLERILVHEEERRQRESMPFVLTDFCQAAGSKPWGFGGGRGRSKKLQARVKRKKLKKHKKRRR